MPQDVAGADALYRGIFEYNPQPMFIYDRETLRFLAVNEAAVSQYGYAREEFLSLTVRDIRPPEDVPRLERALGEQTSGMVRRHGVRHRRKDGSILRVEVTSHGLEFERRRARFVLAVDITERVRAEEELARQKAYFRSLIENASDVITVVDADGMILFESPSVERVLGYAPDELVGRKFFDFIHPDELEEMRDAFRQRVRNPGRPQTTELRFRHKDGSWRTIEVRGEVRLDDPAVGGVVLNSRDLTERKQIEERLRESEATFRSLTENARDLVSIFDAEGVIRYESPSIVKILGYTPEELIGRTLLDLVHPEDQAGIAGVFENSLAHPGENLYYELRFRHRDGTYRWLDGIGRNLLDDPAVRGIVANSRDVTERKAAEAAVREARDELHALVQASPLAIVVLDPDGRISLWNPAAERTFGWTAAEVLGQPIPYVPEEKREEHEALRARSGSGEAFTGVEVERVRKDGQNVAISVSAAPVRGEDGRIRHVISFNEDITERVETRRMLEGYARELERSNRELQDFAYVASHDLQEPLRKIRAFGDRLKNRHADALGAQGIDYLERMQSAAARMQTLIQDLLAYSRVTTKAQPFVPVDLGQIAAEVASDLQARVEQTGGTVVIGDLPGIDADPMQMRQLLQNLLGNALKFVREGVPPVVQVTGTTTENVVELRVQDNGIGFEEQYLDRIFTPFERLHGRGTYEGTGMGLAICRKICERHGGSITARSTPGEGATFCPTLPLHHEMEGGAP